MTPLGKTIPVGLLVMVSLAAMGCASAPRYVVSLDALAEQGIEPGKSYHLMSGSSKVRDSDLQFREFAAQVRRALDFLGLRASMGREDADLVVQMVYGIGEPKLRKVDTSISTINLNHRSDGTKGTVKTERETVTRHASYNRHLQLYFFKVQPGKPPLEIWRTTVMSRGATADLRRVFPVLVSVAMGGIGTNSNNRIWFEISEDDPRVKFVCGQITQERFQPLGSH